MTPSSSKAAVRGQALRRRAEISLDRRSVFAEAMMEALFAAIRGSSRSGEVAVSLFLPIRDEPDTLPLFRALAEAGYGTALPVTPPRGELLRFRAWRVGDDLVTGRFGTVEPAEDAPEIAPDVLVVPVAAYDRQGFRLGYGGGYYDGALRRLRDLKPIFAIGVAFATQAVDAVPTEPHDQRLDALVNEHGVLMFGADP